MDLKTTIMSKVPITVTGRPRDLIKLAAIYRRHAINDMLKQTTLDGCRDTWSHYREFQQNPRFIMTKDQMKEKLTEIQPKATTN